MLIIKYIVDQINHINEAFRGIDPRISGYFFVRSPFNIIILSALYWLFIRKIGPKIMEHFRPFELRKPLLVYNLLQVAANLILITKGIYIMQTNPLYSDWNCMRYDRTSTDMRDVDSAYYYCLLKVFDFTDTIFMVFRKRYKQISFLHVYHHIVMAVLCTLALPAIGCGHFSMIGFANCIVHVIMYTYYFLSALSEKVKKSLWWKKHLTQLQIFQFVYIFYHLMKAFFNKNCDQDKVFLLAAAFQAIVMTVLFAKFYINAYIIKKKKN